MRWVDFWKRSERLEHTHRLLQGKTRADCSWMSSRICGRGHCWGHANINHRGPTTQSCSVSGDPHNESTIGCGWPPLSSRRGGSGQSSLNGQWSAVANSTSAMLWEQFWWSGRSRSLSQCEWEDKSLFYSVWVNSGPVKTVEFTFNADKWIHTSHFSPFTVLHILTG